MNKREKKIVKDNLLESYKFLNDLKTIIDFSYNFDNIESFRKFLIDYCNVMCDLYISGVDTLNGVKK